jgi:hypothetical protein
LIPKNKEKLLISPFQLFSSTNFSLPFMLWILTRMIGAGDWAAAHAIRVRSGFFTVVREVGRKNENRAVYRTNRAVNR